MARPFIAFLLAAVVLASASCGRTTSATHSERLLRRQQVAAVFARAGIRLTYFGEDSGNGNVADYVYFPPAAIAHSKSAFASLEVEVLPVVKTPQEAVRFAGYREDSEDRVVQPLAVVANVIVTVYPGAAQPLRRKIRSAVAALRSLA